MKLTVDRNIADPLFVYYVFRSPDTVQRIHNQAFSSGVPHINLDILRKFEITLPDLAHQQRIASILSAYDDLIENNTRRIKILEEMAQRIYREWFVDFRFPGHENVRMVGSELGLIPERWRVARIADFGTVVTGKTPSTTRPEFFGGDMPFIKTPDMHGHMFCLDVADHLSPTGTASQRNKTVPKDSILVNCKSFPIQDDAEEGGCF